MCESIVMTWCEMAEEADGNSTSYPSHGLEKHGRSTLPRSTVRERPPSRPSSASACEVMRWLEEV